MPDHISRPETLGFSPGSGFIWNVVGSMETGVPPNPAKVSWGGYNSTGFYIGGLAFGWMQNDAGPIAKNEDAQLTFESIIDDYFAETTGVASEVDRDWESQVVEGQLFDARKGGQLRPQLCRVFASLHISIGTVIMNRLKVFRLHSKPGDVPILL